MAASYHVARTARPEGERHDVKF